jgi:hypothetical protein
MDMKAFTTDIRRGMAALMMAAALAGPGTAWAGSGPADVRVTRAPGRVVLDVADEHVKIRKEVRADQSIATLTTRTDSLVLTVRRGVLTISGPWGSMTAGTETGAAHDRLLMVLQRSDAAARGRALLERVTNGPETFTGQALLLTRSILEWGTGSTAAMAEHRQWVAQRAAELARVPKAVPAVTRISWQSRGPGDCWDLYSAEAIRIAQDFEDCTADLAWYEAHKWAGCSLIYAVRAEGAMAWFIACNGGMPISG